jgi:hypothetical protein
MEKKVFKWSAKEVDYLRALVGEYPFRSAVTRYNQAARRRKWPTRTRFSIINKCEKLGLSIMVENSSIIRLADAGKMLKWNKWFTERLARKPDIKAILKPIKYCYWYVERKNLAQLALLRPELFHGVSRDDLYAVIEDMDVVDSIKDHLSCPKKPLYTVICVETGQEWENALIAAKCLNVSRDRIQHSIVTGETIACLGLTFKRARRFRSGKTKQHPRTAHD